ncbi:Trypsin-like peptidase domain-containing protein [Rhodospirillales bacterium URHD0017]|nr:Trypsin-like peptidase domain-containing protein [Rhodospirillales bacterium URHD0017]
MAENAPSPEERQKSRWPLILGGLVGGFLLLAAGLALGWYLFYRPIVNVAVQLPAPPPPPAPPGPDQAQVKALEEQIEKQKAANKQIEDQIALLKERLKTDVCTIKDPLGKAPNSPAPAGALPERKTEAPPGPGKVTPAAASMDLPQTGGQGSGKAAARLPPASLAQALEQATVLVVSAGGDSGSGFFVAPNYVVTNHHVVARAAPGTEALVLSKHLKTGYVGTVVATSQPGQADFAVIKVDDVPAGSVRPLPVATEPAALSDVVAAGYPSIAIAQDRNLRRLLAGDLKAAPEVVLTKGTVSAIQNKERNTPMVLHSADISAGNSGGPLIDSCGRVVGINTYIVTSRQTTKANYALGSSWLAAFLRGSKTPFDWRADSCA